MKHETEYAKFDKTFRALLSVPKSELNKKLEEDKAAKKLRKRTARKPSRAA